MTVRSTTPEAKRPLPIAAWIVAAGSLIAALAAFRAPLLDVADIATEQQLDTLRSQTSDSIAKVRAEVEYRSTRFEQKLDCALWKLPKGCEQALSPHGAQ